MSMIGEYARLTPDELDRALREPDWAQDHVYELQESAYEREQPGEAGVCFDIDKAWDGLRFLLTSVGEAPIDVVFGGTPLGQEDWGYGPARYLAPPEVTVAART